MAALPHSLEMQARPGPVAGDRIGDFELVSPLGAGQPARVWQAVERASGAIVVVKLGAPDLLAREASFLRRVDDPAVARLHRDHSAAATPHLVLAFVDGVELGQVLAGGIAPATVASILVALTDALGALHAAGIVHGDVQPSNVVLRSDGSLVLVDLGSARDWRDGAEADPPMIELTPGYAAPECRQRGERIGPAADLYALGAIGYRALTGRLPGPGAPALTASGGPWPFTLAAALDWALEPSPAARPEDAAELRAALCGAFAADDETVRVRRLPVQAAPDAAPTAPAPRRARKDRRRVLAGLAVLALLAPVAWLGGLAYAERTRLDWKVDPDGDGHARTIAEALEKARSGAILHLAPGTYRETLEITRDVALVGPGDGGARPVISPEAGSCVIARAAAVRLVALDLRSAAGAPCIDLAAGGLAIEASGIAAAEAAAIVARNGTTLSISESTVAGSAVALLAASGARAELAETTLRGPARSAVVARGGAALSLRDVAVEDAGEAGLLLDEGATADLDRVRIAGTGHSGIELRGGARLTLSDALIETSRETGIFVGDGARAVLRGVRVASSRLSGVLAAPGAAVEISGGEIDGSGEHGLTVMDLAQVTLKGTRITGSAGHGIALQPEARFDAADFVLERNKEPQLLDERRAPAAAGGSGR